MQHTLEQFFRALRAADVRISPAEAIDASRAVLVTGYGDRVLFKDALCATLAKTADEVDRFDAVFETFFSRAAVTLPPPPAGSERTEPSEQDMAQAAGSPLAQAVLQGDATAVQQSMEEAAARAGVAEIRLTTQRSRLTRRLLEEMGLEEIERIIANARRMPDGQGEGLANRLDEARRSLFEQAQTYVARQHDLYAAGSARELREERLLRKQLNADGGVDPVDYQLMQAMVKKMAKRLAAKYSRRRRAARNRRIDIAHAQRLELLRRLARSRRRNAGEVDDDLAFGRTLCNTAGAEEDLLHRVLVGDAHHHNVGEAGDFGRRVLRDSAFGRDRNQLFLAAIPHRDRVAGRQQAQRHRLTHEADADEAEFWKVAHIFPRIMPR